MRTGRPVKSQVRQNIVELLLYTREGYGYEIAKLYNAVYPKVSQRVIYYHLKKGLATGEFSIKIVRTEDGDYSWGSMAEKTYYCLGQRADAKCPKSVMDRIDKIRSK